MKNNLKIIFKFKQYIWSLYKEEKIKILEHFLKIKFVGELCFC